MWPPVSAQPVSLSIWTRSTRPCCTRLMVLKPHLKTGGTQADPARYTPWMATDPDCGKRAVRRNTVVRVQPPAGRVEELCEHDFRGAARQDGAQRPHGFADPRGRA